MFMVTVLRFGLKPLILAVESRAESSNAIIGGRDMADSQSDQRFTMKTPIADARASPA